MKCQSVPMRPPSVPPPGVLVEIRLLFSEFPWRSHQLPGATWTDAETCLGHKIDQATRAELLKIYPDLVLARGRIMRRSVAQHFLARKP